MQVGGMLGTWELSHLWALLALAVVSESTEKEVDLVRFT